MKLINSENYYNSSKKVFNANLWIFLASNKKNGKNQQRWNTEKISSTKMEYHVFFIQPLLSNFPREDSFWLAFPFDISKLKMKNKFIPSYLSFKGINLEKLDKLCPLLKRKR